MKKRLLLLLLLTLWTIPSFAAIKICIGPKGENFFTNQECPPGYHLENDRPETDRSADVLPNKSINPGITRDPYICRNADVIYSYDIDGALKEAESNIKKYTKESKREKAQYWSNCLLRLEKRKAELAAETKSKRVSSAPSVVLYTTSWCPYCKKARSFFRSRGIRFTDHDVERDREAARRRRTLYGDGDVPLAIINGAKILGFSAARYEEALKTGK